LTEKREAPAKKVKIQTRANTNRGIGSRHQSRKPGWHARPGERIGKTVRELAAVCVACTACNRLGALDDRNVKTSLREIECSGNPDDTGTKNNDTHE
jgi:hypothetical protein